MEEEEEGRMRKEGRRERGKEGITCICAQCE